LVELWGHIMQALRRPEMLFQSVTTS